MTGTVTDQTSSPLAGICVDALELNGGSSASAVTASDGTYTIGNIVPSAYLVEFSACNAPVDNYLTQWYGDVPAEQQATAVNVPAGGVTPGIGAAMVLDQAAGGSISGTVTNSSGKALSEICVKAVPVRPGLSQGSGRTTVNGTYAISGLFAGSYDVEFTIGCGSMSVWLTQWYTGVSGGTPTQKKAVAVVVTGHANTPNINATMKGAGSITGSITNPAGVALVGICAIAVPVGSTGAGTTFPSSATGKYGVLGLAPGQYQMEFTQNCGGAPGWQTQWYDGQPGGSPTRAGATHITVVAAKSTAGINAVLQPAASISGTVTDVGTGAPIQGVCVKASPDLQSTGSALAVSAADGTYTLAGLPSGGFVVSFNEDCGEGPWIGQWYDGLTGGSSQLSGASIVNATIGQTTTGINAEMVS